MGFCHEPTPDMGRFEVETRRESFYLHIQDASRPHPEFLYTDIPALRAALNQAAQDTEFAAPSVGELEWREPDWCCYVSGPFHAEIYPTEDGGSGYTLHLRVHGAGGEAEFKSLANSLQRILSGAAE